MAEEREREDKGDLASSGSVPEMFEKKIFLSGNMILILEAAAAELSPAGWLRKRLVAP